MRVALVILLALCLPVFLLATNIRVMALTPAFYEWGFQRHRISEATGLSPEQLRHVASAFITYFHAPPGRMDVRVRINGKDVPLFNEREIAHMVDVQALMHRLGMLQLLTGLAILAALAGLAVLEQRVLGPTAGLALLAGAGLTIAMLVLLGLATLLDFSTFWTRFHLVAFSNDLWLLDPARDNLIRLYPPEFWADATLLLAAGAALEALVLGGIGLAAYSGVLAARPAAPLLPAEPPRR
jgi:integral membrane protein (TIGR01906 family)